VLLRVPQRRTGQLRPVRCYRGGPAAVTANISVGFQRLPDRTAVVRQYLVKKTAYLSADFSGAVRARMTQLAEKFEEMVQ
jgi:hypothetical protein